MRYSCRISFHRSQIYSRNWYRVFSSFQTSPDTNITNTFHTCDRRNVESYFRFSWDILHEAENVINRKYESPAEAEDTHVPRIISENSNILKDQFLSRQIGFQCITRLICVVYICREWIMYRKIFNALLKGRIYIAEKYNITHIVIIIYLTIIKDFNFYVIHK